MTEAYQDIKEIFINKDFSKSIKSISDALLIWNIYHLNLAWPISF